MMRPTEFAAQIAANHIIGNRDFTKKIGYFPTPSEGGRLLFKEVGLDFSSMADLGAGGGMLTAAAIEAAARSKFAKEIHCTLYENQIQIIPLLRKVMKYTQTWAKKMGIKFRYSIRCVDLMDVFLNEDFEYTLVVSNPPFVRVPAGSDLKEQAKKFMCKTNLYGAFMEGALKWTSQKGHLLLITPTSWKNGLYFSKLRENFLPKVRLERIVSFKHRHNVFKNVLQDIEFTIWCKGKRLTTKSKVKITLAEKLSKVEPYSEFELLHEALIPNRDRGEILTPDHPEQLALIQSVSDKLTQTLDDLKVEVLIGQVVMFRESDGVVNSKLRREVDLQLIREHHIRPTGLLNQVEGKELEQWIRQDSPNIKSRKNIVLVSRRGAKNDRRRLVTSFVTEHHGGIENKVMYLERTGRAAPTLMKGISAFMNSSFADIQIRCICGGTMINKGDLLRLRLPKRKNLLTLGKMLESHTEAKELDRLIASLFRLEDCVFDCWEGHFSPWKSQ